MTFEHFYQSELGFLRESGSAFSELHPAIAGLLAERGGDPDVQRLLEGFAFLTARMRQRIDDVTPSLVASLLELTVPQLCRPTPASTVVEFSPSPKSVRGRQTVRAGTGLAATPVAGTSCQFRTSNDVTLLPCTIERQALDDSSPSRPRILLDLAVARGGLPALLQPEGLRFHLHGDTGLCAQLQLWLMRYCTGVTVFVGESRFLVPAKAVVGIGHDLPLLPWPAFAPRGLLRLLEYLTFVPKFLFFELRDLHHVAASDADTLRLQFEFERPPPLPSPMPGNTFRLHCVPAVNLFDTSADPVRLEPLQRPQLVRGASTNPLHCEVFSVNSVVGVLAGGRRRTYEPFLGFSSSGSHYHVRREVSPIDDGLNHFVSIVGESAGSDTSTRTLSIDLTCTNRSLPCELGVGDVRVPMPDSPTGVPFANISAVSRPARPPLGDKAFNAFIGHLASAQRRLTDVKVLRQLLSTYNFQDRFDHPSGRVNRSRIEAIERCTSSPTTRIIEGAAVRGSSVQLALREDGFVSAGDAFLFASVLDSMLAMQTPLNSFTELSVLIVPGNLAMKWSPRWST